MRVLSVCAALLVVVVVAAPARAAIDEGDWEVSLGGQWMISEFDTNYGLNLRLGYFVTPNVQVGGWLGFRNQRYKGKARDSSGAIVAEWNHEASTFDIAAFAAYYFEVAEDWYPYLGGFVGYDSTEIKENIGERERLKRDGFNIGGFAGVKFFLSQRASVFVEYRITWRDQDNWEYRDGTRGTVSDDSISHLFLVGVSFLF
jgi:outer membrane protein W